MTTIKRIVSDIDGTLVDDQGQLLPATIKGVQAAVAQGAQMVLASARSPKGMFGIAQQLGINSTMIAYNGALTATTDVNDQLTVYEQCAIQPRVTDLAVWLKRTPTPVHKIMIMADPDVIQAIEQRLMSDEFEQLAVYRSKDTYLEIVAAGVTKAAALIKLLQDDQVTPAEAIAFGDNFNDVAMLQTGGVGIAMANAPQAVKNAANTVTTDNNHDGIQATLARYFS
ncbi:Cof-type HAD-IIB family hydrolase [Lactiplantibacillus paraplantarum]|uniref:Cof-type HAD-IIB family hydrolase n=1 Tax=Lactiplantibacillus paraplantarum TaxID=60520 RepID=UPI0020736042|nr:Cof-type HAD-IIB family hydrolase [Lactiplantibacillus paraplantarum]